MANAENKIALTFDDGPHPYYTPQILAILEKYKVKATFFIVGENAEFYPEVLQQIQKSGHEIGNHTVSELIFDGENKETNRQKASRGRCENVPV